MPSPTLLLRCLLIVTFCLEGSLSLWASSAMAVDKAHHTVDKAHHATTAEQTRPVASGQDCEDPFAEDRGGSAHHDCDCGQGLGCACLLVFPAMAFNHVLPFAAQHLLATVPAGTPRAPLVVTAATRVFRPPIG